MPKNKTDSLCYRLNKNSSEKAQEIANYLQTKEDNFSPNQRINEVVFQTFLPLAVSKDHPDYERIVIESINYHIRQLNLLRDTSGFNPESLKDFQNSSLNKSNYINQFRPQVTVQTSVSISNSDFHDNR